MEDKILNEKESLELISKMIQNTQTKLESGKGKPFLIFGYIAFIVSIAVYVLLVTTNNQYANLLWWAIPLLGGLFMYKFGRSKDKYAKTYIDRMINTVWAVIGTVMILVSFFAFFNHSFPMVSLMLLLSGIASTLTGLIIKYVPIVICGIIGTLTCVLPFLFYGSEKVLIYTVAVFVMMVIPGHILNYKGRKANV